MSEDGGMTDEPSAQTGAGGPADGTATLRLVGGAGRIEIRTDPTIDELFRSSHEPGTPEVVVEGDMVIPRVQLLEQAEAHASGVVEKGYFNPGDTKFAGNRISLAFKPAGGGFTAVSDPWKIAFRDAAKEWNERTPGFKTLVVPVNAKTITVRMGSINTTQTARADGFPPALGIQINRDFSGCSTNIEGLSAAQKVNVALHEIGHILGFEHPPPLTGSVGRVHIAGTAISTATSGNASTYDTVMQSRCLSDIKLRDDDVVSAGKKYPGPTCRQLCEFNCTFNVDPGQIGLCQAACPQQCGG